MVVRPECVRFLMVSRRKFKWQRKRNAILKALHFPGKTSRIPNVPSLRTIPLLKHEATRSPLQIPVFSAPIEYIMPGE